MSYRWKPKYAEVDPDNPQMWGTCDRCGRVHNTVNLTWQYDYRGTQLENLRILVCPKCYDKPQPQLAPYILPPDPPPIFNARPETYEINETNYFVTEDGSILTAEPDTPLIPSNPNPEDSPNVSLLAASLSYPGGSVASIFLDLFDGDPLNGGVSVLSIITGSAVRPDIGPQLGTANGVAVNPDVLTVASSSAGQTNLNYIGLYSQATAGFSVLSGLLSSGPLSATSPPSIVFGAEVRFDSVALSVDLT